MWPLYFEHASSTASRSRTSHSKATKAPPTGTSGRSSSSAASHRALLRPNAMTPTPFSTSSLHTARPMPLVPPKTRACLNASCVLVASAISYCSPQLSPQLSSLSSHPWSAGAEETDQKLVHADQFTLSSTLRMKWHKLAIWSHYLPLLHNPTKGLSNQKMFALSCIMLGPSPDIRKLQSAGCRMVF